MVATLVCAFLPSHYVEAQTNVGMMVPHSHASGNQTGFYAAGELIFLRPSADIPFAFIDGTSNNTLDSNARVQTISFDYEASFRVSIGYDKPNSPWNWSLTYTRVDSDQTAFAVEPTGGELIVRPDGGPLDRANARMNFELNIVDLVAKYDLRIAAAGDDSVFEMALFGGLRYADTENDFNFVYIRGNCPDNCTEDIQTDFWGIGPRVGAEFA